MSLGRRCHTRNASPSNVHADNDDGGRRRERTSHNQNIISFKRKIKLVGRHACGIKSYCFSRGLSASGFLIFLLIIILLAVLGVAGSFCDMSAKPHEPTRKEVN